MNRKFRLIGSLILSVLMFFSEFSNDLKAQGSTESDLYCAAHAGCGVYIHSTSISSYTNSGTVCSSNGYGNYTLQPVSLNLNQTFTITVAGTNTTANTVCKVFIDWAMNADFNDPGEEILLNGSPGPGPYTATVTVPSSTNAGQTRLRVRIGTGTVIACGTSTTGEIEDYTLVLSDNLMISSLPATSFCTGDSVMVGINGGGPYNAGNQFIIQLSNSAGSFSSPAQIGILSSLNPGPVPCYLPSSLANGTAYRMRVIASDPAQTSVDNGSNLTINKASDLQLSSGTFNLCEPLTFDLTTCYTDLNNVSGTVTYWSDAACTQPVPDPANISVSGTYYIKKVATVGGCSDLASIVLVFHPHPVVNAGPDLSVLPMVPVQLEAIVSGGNSPYIVQWSPAAGLNNPMIFQPLATIATTTTYTVTVTDNQGCSSSDEILLTVVGPTNGTLQVNVNYQNTANTPMNNVDVQLWYNGMSIISGTTDAAGLITFNSVPAGNYTIKCSSTKPWGGGNAIDGLLMMKHFVGVITLTEVKLKAGDVDHSGFVNANDGLMTMRRFVGIISSFTSGDWAFEEPVVTVTQNNTTTVNIKTVCYGDVDGSYVPAP